MDRAHLFIHLSACGPLCCFCFYRILIQFLKWGLHGISIQIGDAFQVCFNYLWVDNRKSQTISLNQDVKLSSLNFREKNTLESRLQVDLDSNSSVLDWGVWSQEPPGGGRGLTLHLKVQCWGFAALACILAKPKALGGGGGGGTVGWLEIQA